MWAGTQLSLSPLVICTAERELLVSSDTYRQRSVASMKLPGAVVREMAFTL